MEQKETRDNIERNLDNNYFKKFIIKEVLDKIGFGFGSLQFINVLLFLSGASIFLVGIVNGLKVVLSTLVIILAQEYNKFRRISKRVIGFSGIFFGFSFLFMAFGKLINSPSFFSIAILLSGMSIVIYGDFSQNFFMIGKKREILEKIAKYGLIVTAISLFLSAFLLDKYGEGTFFILTLLDKPFIIKLPGYVITFEIAALAFILSGYFLASIKDKSIISEERFTFSLFSSNFKKNLMEILKNKFLLALMIFNIVGGLVQVVGNSYYGIFIYQNFKNNYFGGFLNIAIVFLIGVFSSLIGYFITKINTKSYGSISMLIIGSLFLSIMSFSYYLGSNLALLTAGTILGIIGSSALGVSTNMVVIETLHEQDRRYYYIFNGIFSLIPYIAFVPILSYIAQEYNLNFLFLLLGMLTVSSAIFIILSFKFLSKDTIKS